MKLSLVLQMCCCDFNLPAFFSSARCIEHFSNPQACGSVLVRSWASFRILTSLRIEWVHSQLLMVSQACFCMFGVQAWWVGGARVATS